MNKIAAILAFLSMSISVMAGTYQQYVVWLVDQDVPLEEARDTVLVSPAGNVVIWKSPLKQPAAGVLRDVVDCAELLNTPKQYWKKTGNKWTVMASGEKKQVDDASANASVTVDTKPKSDQALISSIVVHINQVRERVGLATITVKDFEETMLNEVKK